MQSPSPPPCAADVTPAIAVELSVPAFGIWCAAFAATVRPDGIFLSTFEDLDADTRARIESIVPRIPIPPESGVRPRVG